jgi:hypothetical protein
VCADEACKDMSDASVVLAVGFSEPITNAAGGAAASDDIEVFIEGGTATVVSTFDVVENEERRSRRLQGDVAGDRMAIGVVTSSAGTGGEVIKFRAKPGAIRDAGAWRIGHDHVVSAYGSLVQPYVSLKSGAKDVGIQLASASASAVFGPTESSGDSMLIIIAAGGAAGLACLFCTFFCLRRRRSSKLQKRRAALRMGKDGFRQTRLDSLCSVDDEPQASAAAMTIASQLDWLRAPLGAVSSPSRSPTSMSKSSSTAALISCDLRETGRWIDMLADGFVSAVEDAQPRCHLPARILKAAHEAHSELQKAPAINDLAALECLVELLEAEPIEVPVDLLVAASSLDRSADESATDFGEAQMVARLKVVLDSSSALPPAISDALSSSAAGHMGGGDFRQKKQLSCLIRDALKGTRSRSSWPGRWCRCASRRSNRPG